MKALIVSALLLVTPFAFAMDPETTLSFSNGAVLAHLTWADNSPDSEGGESRMFLEWLDGKTHQAIDPVTAFEVSLFMPSMGHGSAPTQIQRVLDGNGNVVMGFYEITNMYFLMPGDWDVRVALQNATGGIETRSWSVVIGGSSDHGHH